MSKPLKKPATPEEVEIAKLMYPGWREFPETPMDFDVNIECIRGVRKARKAIDKVTDDGAKLRNVEKLYEESVKTWQEVAGDEQYIGFGLLLEDLANCLGHGVPEAPLPEWMKRV